MRRRASDLLPLGLGLCALPIATVALLAHIAEVDARRLFVPAGFSSMHEYCVQTLGLTHDVTCKRIRAARAARRFPEIFAALNDGRLHVSGVALAPGSGADQPSGPAQRHRADLRSGHEGAGS